MKMYTNAEQIAKLIKLGFEKPKSIGGYAPTFVVEYEDVEVSNIIIGENKQCPIFAYSIGELIKMLPSYVEWEGNYYGLQIKTECTYSWTVSYEPTHNDKAKIFPVYDGGSCLIDILYNVLINLVALRDELTDTGGHDEYNQGEVLSEVFKLKEEEII